MRENITFNEKGKHLTYEQRKILARAWNEAVRNMAAWLSFASFARKMGICRQTWMNEYRLGGGIDPVPDLKHKGRFLYGLYDPDRAQQEHNFRASQKGRRMLYTNKIDIAFAILIHDKKRKMSPADARIELMKSHPDWRMPSLGTFYFHIRNGSSSVRYGETPYHPTCPHREKKAHPALVALGRRKMADRPAPANERSENGHWEMDTVVSCVTGKGGLLVLFDRRRSKYVARYIQAINQRCVLCAIRWLIKHGDLDIVRSVTTDNGCEFLNQKALDGVFGALVYYTRAYAAWEKGSVENCNRILRRWFPKGTDFSLVRKRDIAIVIGYINSIHRNTLGWLSADEFASQDAAA